MFRVEVNGNQAGLVQREPITSGSVQAYLMEFSFSEEWSELDRVAVFKTTGDVIEVGLDETNQCFIPWELMTDPDVKIQFGVYGSRGAEVVLPTIWVATDSILQGVVTGVEGSEPTETLTGQLIKKIDDLDSRVDAIENGESGPGSPGKDGQDGFSPTVEVQPIDGGHEVTITDVNGPQSFNVMDGHDGKEGPVGPTGKDGMNGATFTPAVSKDGVLSWTNNNGLPNPEPVSIKGPPGDAGTGEDSGEVYSTEEVRIGTWIDGKPLYRRVLSITSPVSAERTMVIGSISSMNIETIGKMSCLQYNTHGFVQPVPFYSKSDDQKYYGVTIWIDGSDIKSFSENSYHTAMPMLLILEYTKTTDNVERR